LAFAPKKFHFQLYIRDKIPDETHMHALYTVNHIELLRLHEAVLSKGPMLINLYLKLLALPPFIIVGL